MCQVAPYYTTIVTLWNIYLFLHSKIEQTLHDVFGVFYVNFVSLPFCLKKSNLAKELPFYFVKKKSKQMGSMDFVLVTKQDLLSVNNLHSLVSTFVYVSIITHFDITWYHLIVFDITFAGKNWISVGINIMIACSTLQWFLNIKSTEVFT